MKVHGILFYEHEPKHWRSQYHKVWHNGYGWCATTIKDTGCEGYGDTPEEALAALDDDMGDVATKLAEARVPWS